MTQNSDRQFDVSILVVAYNSADLIEKCLQSISTACAHYNYEVLLVDNGDGSTEELVASRFPAVVIVPSRGNVGFAVGNNMLASEARGRNLLLLNPDVELLPGSVDALLEASQRYPGASAWGGVTLKRDGSPDIGNTVHVPSLREMASRVLGRSTAGLPKGKVFAEDEETAVLSGGFVMISRSAWDEADGLDDSYFLYCEEVDFFYRLAKAGHRFWRIASARAFHDIGHGETLSPRRVLYRAAGVMHFSRIHWSRPRHLCAFLLTWIGALQRFGVGAILAPFGERFRTLRDAYRALAMKPLLWRFGYDPQLGLLARLSRDQRG